MTKIGPVMLDIQSTRLNDEDIELLKNPLVGGLIIFSRNIESAEQVLSLCNQIRAVNPEILIAVDQEGGRVQRLVKGFSKLPPLANLGVLASKNKEMALEFASDLGELMALEVQSVGCDISFAPVLDLGLESSRIIGNRAFSTDPDMICDLANAYVLGMKKAGMQATGKHYPGHGSVEADSHHEIPIDLRSLETIQTLDLIPFSRMADHLGAMMPAHIVYSQVDEKPAGFSEIWLKQILRSQIGFDGVIFSDDLSMKGAETAGSFLQRAEAALEAGCDMILICNDRSAALEILAGLESRTICHQSSQRLARLRMRDTQAIGLSALKISERWQQLSNRLEEFNRQIAEIEE